MRLYDATTVTIHNPKAANLRSLDLSVRTCLINDARKLVCQYFKCFIDWNAEMPRDLFDLIACECRPDLVGGDFHIGTIA